MLNDARLVRLMKRGDTAISRMSKAETDGDAIRIKKLDTEEQVVFGEVYAPGFPDRQGDFMLTDEIKKMAYNFLRKGNMSNIDTNHSQMPNGSYVVESFIARDNDPVFIPGSWVIGVKVPDAGVWQMVKSGELNGFSLDGMGVRNDTTFEIEMPELLKGETDDTPGHKHTFAVKFDDGGNFLGGRTSFGLDGHFHLIKRGTCTETVDGHSHRFSFVEGVLGAQVQH